MEMETKRIEKLAEVTEQCKWALHRRDCETLGKEQWCKADEAYEELLAEASWLLTRVRELRE